MDEYELRDMNVSTYDNAPVPPRPPPKSASTQHCSKNQFYEYVLNMEDRKIGNVESSNFAILSTFFKINIFVAHSMILLTPTMILCSKSIIDNFHEKWMVSDGLNVILGLFYIVICLPVVVKIKRIMNEVRNVYVSGIANIDEVKQVAKSSKHLRSIRVCVSKKLIVVTFHNQKAAEEFSKSIENMGIVQEFVNFECTWNDFGNISLQQFSMLMAEFKTREDILCDELVIMRVSFSLVANVYCMLSSILSILSILFESEKFNVILFVLFSLYFIVSLLGVCGGWRTHWQIGRVAHRDKIRVLVPLPADPEELLNTVNLNKVLNIIFLEQSKLAILNIEDKVGASELIHSFGFQTVATHMVEVKI